MNSHHLQCVVDKQENNHGYILHETDAGCANSFYLDMNLHQFMQIEFSKDAANKIIPIPGSLKSLMQSFNINSLYISAGCLFQIDIEKDENGRIHSAHAISFAISIQNILVSKNISIS